jgi:ADP-ribose pyrophosphatase YjhB (NUDIX family)
MLPRECFRHCPRCGAPQTTSAATNPFVCAACGFRYFFNPTVAVAVFVRRSDGRVLFIRRAKDPGRGRLAPPGGFIDIGETAEIAATREVREEVGLEIHDLTFLCSEPNEYLYAGVTYPVLDFFFTARAAGAETASPEEVESCSWLDPLGVAPTDMAFPSMQRALALWQGTLNAGDHAR